MRQILPILAIASLAGCQGGSTLYPLKTGNTWVYEAVSPIGKNVRTVRAVGPASVGPYPGFALGSESGTTELAWASGTLYASRLAGTTYTPPLPLLKDGSGPRTWEWTGKVVAPGGSIDARASAKSAPEDRTVAGRTAKTTMVTIQMQGPGTRVETISWYEKGVGLVAQEQRSGGALVTKLNYVSGP